MWFCTSASTTAPTGCSWARTAVAGSTSRRAQGPDRAVAQRHRRILLAELPSHHYVTPTDFADNLASMTEVLVSRDVRQSSLRRSSCRRFECGRPSRRATELRPLQPTADGRRRERASRRPAPLWANQHRCHLTSAGHRLFATRSPPCWAASRSRYWGSRSCRSGAASAGRQRRSARCRQVVNPTLHRWARRVVTRSSSQPPNG